MSKIENGLSSPEVYTLARVADVLGVPLERLVKLG